MSHSLHNTLRAALMVWTHLHSTHTNPMLQRKRSFTQCAQVIPRAMPCGRASNISHWCVHATEADTMMPATCQHLAWASHPMATK